MDTETLSQEENTRDRSNDVIKEGGEHGNRLFR